MSKLDLDKPVQTVSGIPVTLLKRDARGLYPLIGVLETDPATGQFPQCWSEGGGYLSDPVSSSGPCLMDLVNVPPRTRKEKVWLVFHESGGVYLYYEKPNLELIALFGIKELEVEVTEGENLP